MLLPIHEFSISNVDATATSLLRRDIALGGEIELAQQAADLKRVPTKKMTRGGGRGGTAGGGRNNVGFVKPQEPKFLREIKEKVGSGLDLNFSNLLVPRWDTGNLRG